MKITIIRNAQGLVTGIETSGHAACDVNDAAVFTLMEMLEMSARETFRPEKLSITKDYDTPSSKIYWSGETERAGFKVVTDMIAKYLVRFCRLTGTEIADANDGPAVCTNG